MAAEVVENGLPAGALHFGGVLGFGVEGDADQDAILFGEEVDFDAPVAEGVG